MNQINLIGLDLTSQKILQHLQNVQSDLEHENSVTIESYLIENYSRTVLNDRSIIFGENISNDGSINEIKDNQYLLKFIPILSNLLEYPISNESVEAITQLLKSILNHLTFTQINYFFSIDFILRGIQSQSSNIIKLIVSIFSIKINDPHTIEFLISSDTLDILLSKLFSSNEDESELTSMSIANTIEKFISQIISCRQYSIIESKLLNENAVKSYQLIKAQDDSILGARLLDYIILLIPILDQYIDISFPSSLLDFNSNLFLKNISDDDYDVLYVALIIDFYFKAIQSLNQTNVDPNFQSKTFEAFKFPIKKLIKIYSIETQSNEKYHSNDIITIFKVLSDSKSNQVETFFKNSIIEYKLLKSYNIDVDNEIDRNFLSILKFEIFDENVLSDFYEDIIIDLPLLNAKYISILSNLITSSYLFHLIISNKTNYLSNEKLSKLSLDYLYPVLEVFSRFHHSVEYLLEHLPSIVNDYLISTSDDLRDNRLWNLKLQILQNLLFGKFDLKIWGFDLEKSYKLMKFGRNIQNVEPQVDVIDDTA